MAMLPPRGIAQPAVAVIAGEPAAADVSTSIRPFESNLTERRRQGSHSRRRLQGNRWRFVRHSRRRCRLFWSLWSSCSRRGAASVADRRAVDVRPAARNFAGDRRVSDNNLHQTRLAVVDCHGCPKETARKIARTPRATFAITHWKCPRNCRKGRAGRQAGSRAFRPLVHHVQIRQRDRRPTFGLWARIVVGGYRTRARSRDEMNESNLFVASSTKKRRPSLASARPKSAPAPFGLPDLSSSAVPACLPAA